MKSLFALMMAIFFVATAQAEQSDIVIAASDYSCTDLQEIVNVHGVVYMEGLDSRNVYAHAADACPGDFPNEDRGMWFQTYWETNDGTNCRVGYGCLDYRGAPTDGDLGDGDIPDVKK